MSAGASFIGWLLLTSNVLWLWFWLFERRKNRLNRLVWDSTRRERDSFYREILSLGFRLQRFKGFTSDSHGVQCQEYVPYEVTCSCTGGPNQDACADAGCVYCIKARNVGSGSAAYLTKVD